MSNKLLVRKDRDNDELILVFVPSATAPKGYIKRWDGGQNFTDVSLDSYKATRDTDAEQQQRALTRYQKETKVSGVRLAQRLPRDYQQTPSEDDFRVLPQGVVFVVEDAKGVFQAGFTDLESALRAMEALKVGKSLRGN